MPTKKAKRRSPKPAKTEKAKPSVRKPASPSTALAVVSISEITKPEMYRGKMTLAPTSLTEKQIMAIVAPTPAHIVKQRPGKGGGQWDYVPGWWFKKKANFVFGFAHDFEILGERIDGDYITVKGKVTVRDPKTGRVIATKSDFGGAAIKFKKDTAHTPTNYLDISNDFKAAATDSFKRCMVQFGFAMDVYGKSESINEGMVVQTEAKAEPKPAPIKTTTQEHQLPDFECRECGEPVTATEAAYSKKFFKGKIYCRNCQRLAKQGVIR